MDRCRNDSHKRLCSIQDDVLVGLWLLADRFAVDGLQNAVMRAMLNIGQKCGRMSSGCFVTIYENTAPGSPLRRLVIDQSAWKGPSNFVGDAKWYPHEMLSEIAEVFYKAAPAIVRSKKAGAILAEAE
jgi:hypothetical protein